MGAHAHIVDMPQLGKDRHRNSYPEKGALKLSPGLGMEGGGAAARAVWRTTGAAWTRMGRHQPLRDTGKKETHVAAEKVPTVFLHDTSQTLQMGSFPQLYATRSL